MGLCEIDLRILLPGVHCYPSPPGTVTVSSIEWIEDLFWKITSKLIEVIFEKTLIICRTSSRARECGYGYYTCIPYVIVCKENLSNLRQLQK